MQQDKPTNAMSSFASYKRTWDLKGPEPVYSAVYTLVMAKIVHVQIHGVDMALSIRADKVEEGMTNHVPPNRLSLSPNGVLVGEFKTDLVDGWWIEETEKSSGPGDVAL